MRCAVTSAAADSTADAGANVGTALGMEVGKAAGTEEGEAMGMEEGVATAGSLPPLGCMLSGYHVGASTVGRA